MQYNISNAYFKKIFLVVFSALILGVVIYCVEPPNNTIKRTFQSELKFQKNAGGSAFEIIGI